jgi:glutathione S-transferase
MTSALTVSPAARKPFTAGRLRVSSGIRTDDARRLGAIAPFAQDLPLNHNANLKAWLERVLERPAVQKGLTMPEPFPQEKQFEAFIKATVGLGDLHK